MTKKQDQDYPPYGNGKQEPQQDYVRFKGEQKPVVRMTDSEARKAVEPEPICPALLKDGKHEWMEFDDGWFCNYCRIPRPANLKPAEPEMPLDEQILQILWHESHISQEEVRFIVSQIMKAVRIERQAHDQQVRKALLDEIEQKYKILLSHRHNKKTTEFYIHINPDDWQEFRVMTEKEG